MILCATAIILIMGLRSRFIDLCRSDGMLGWQSFSPPMIDYLKYGIQILEVYFKDVAFIDPLIQNNCAIVANSKEEVIEKLNVIIADGFLLEQIAYWSQGCCRKHHNKQDIQQTLRVDFEKVCSK